MQEIFLIYLYINIWDMKLKNENSASINFLPLPKDMWCAIRNEKKMEMIVQLTAAG